jgi:parvulin-like peptidyl-prolyl isomerase
MRFFAAGLFAAVLLAGARVRADQNYIQARVGDALITRYQVQEESAPRLDYLYQQYLERPTRANSNLFYSNSIAVQQETFDRLINFNLVMQEFKTIEEKLAKQGIKPIPESEVDNMVQERIQDPKYGGDRVRFLKDLQKQGTTLEKYRAQLRDQLVFRGMIQQYVPEPIISPHQIENYYREHQDSYKMSERVKMRTIFLKKTADNADESKHRAEGILASYRAGSSFKDLERTYSEIPGAATDGNEDPQWVELEGKSQAIRDALAKIKPSEATDVIETGEGFFIVLLEARDPAHVRGLNDPDNSPRGEIEKDLVSQERDRRMKAWFKRLENKTFLEKF